MAHQSEAEAAAWLTSQGYRRSATNSELWVGRGKVDDFYGGYQTTFVASIVRHKVAQEYGGGEYFEVRFH